MWAQRESTPHLGSRPAFPHIPSFYQATQRKCPRTQRASANHRTRGRGGRCVCMLRTQAWHSVHDVIPTDRSGYAAHAHIPHSWIAAGKRDLEGAIGGSRTHTVRGSRACVAPVRGNRHGHDMPATIATSSRGPLSRDPSRLLSRCSRPLVLEGPCPATPLDCCPAAPGGGGGGAQSSAAPGGKPLKCAFYRRGTLPDTTATYSAIPPLALKEALHVIDPAKCPVPLAGNPCWLANPLGVSRQSH